MKREVYIGKFLDLKYDTRVKVEECNELRGTPEILSSETLH